MISKGDFESARSKLVRALELDPESKYCQETLQKVEEMLKLESTKDLNEKIVEMSSLQEDYGAKRNHRCCFCAIF